MLKTLVFCLIKTHQLGFFTLNFSVLQQSKIQLSQFSKNSIKETELNTVN